ncbi:MAG: FkbM family methyltransferase [bacterium]
MDTGDVNECKRCRHGSLLYNLHDAHIGRSLQLYGEWAEGEMKLLGQLLRPGDLVLDVGANIGTHTLFFARTVGKNGTVLAFEPQRIVFQTLCANVALNSLLNVHTFHAAVGAKNDSVVVPPIDYETTMNFGGVSLGSHREGEIVPMLPLDDLDLPACRLLKIDVEGMELAVLQGAQRLIETAKPIVYLENNDPERSGILIAHLLELGYVLYWHFSPFYNADNYFANTNNVFGNIVDVNMLAVTRQVAGLIPVTGPDDTAGAALARAR